VGAAPVRAESPERVRVDAGQAIKGAGKTAGIPEAPGPKTAKLPRVEMGNCPAICEKLQGCKAGPFDSVSECATACEAAIDDPTSAKTYRCVARAIDCKKVGSCAR
jgi:hypothetical protein